MFRNPEQRPDRTPTGLITAVTLAALMLASACSLSSDTDGTIQLQPTTTLDNAVPIPLLALEPLPPTSVPFTAEQKAAREAIASPEDVKAMIDAAFLNTKALVNIYDDQKLWEITEADDTGAFWATRGRTPEEFEGYTGFTMDLSKTDSIITLKALSKGNLTEADVVEVWIANGTGTYVVSVGPNEVRTSNVNIYEVIDMSDATNPLFYTLNPVRPPQSDTEQQVRVGDLDDANKRFAEALSFALQQTSVNTH